MSPELTEYLIKYYTTKMLDFYNQGIRRELSFKEFIDHCVTPDQLESLQAAINGDYLWSMQKSTNREGKPNLYALVISWVSYSARSTNVANKDTIIMCSRRSSAQRCVPKAGDKLRESHKQSISVGTKGVPKKPWSPERKAARSALRREQEARKRNNK